jgi:hypothetical protein
VKTHIIIIRQTLKRITKVGGRGLADTPWKPQKNYYNYEFTANMNFIDHQVRYPIFRAIDLEGNILNPKYEVVDKANATRMLEVMITNREVDKSICANKDSSIFSLELI